MPLAQDITVCLIGFEQHKARPDLSDPSGFWLYVKVEDVFPFAAAFSDAPDGYHVFVIEQRVGKQTRSSTLIAQIVRIKDGPAEKRVLIRPDPVIEAALLGALRE